MKIFRCIFFPYYKYQEWKIKYELHISRTGNPISIIKRIWNGIIVSSVPLTVIVIGFCVYYFFKEEDKSTVVFGIFISLVGFIFGIAHNKEKIILEGILSISRQLKGNIYSDRHQVVLDAHRNFNNQLFIYSNTVNFINISIFAIGVSVSIFL